MGAQVGYIEEGIFKSQDEVDNHAKQDGAAVGRMRWKDLNGDKVITEADQDWIYDPTPDFSYGFNVYLEYKNFDFTMFWQGVQGVDVISDLKRETDIWAGLNIGFLNKGKRLTEAWSATNPGSNIPALSLSDNNNEKRVSSYWVENGSYLKLRTIQLGYNLPKDISKYFSNVRLYCSIQNLYTFTNYEGYNPEVSNRTDATTSGEDYGVYPLARTFTLGLNLKFSHKTATKRRSQNYLATLESKISQEHLQI